LAKNKKTNKKTLPSAMSGGSEQRIFKKIKKLCRVLCHLALGKAAVTDANAVTATFLCRVLM
jgi:hypothetical protein